MLSGGDKAIYVCFYVVIPCYVLFTIIEASHLITFLYYLTTVSLSFSLGPVFSGLCVGDVSFLLQTF